MILKLDIKTIAQAFIKKRCKSAVNKSKKIYCEYYLLLCFKRFVELNSSTIQYTIKSDHLNITENIFIIFFLTILFKQQFLLYYLLKKQIYNHILESKDFSRHLILNYVILFSINNRLDCFELFFFHYFYSRMISK